MRWRLRAWEKTCAWTDRHESNRALNSHYAQKVYTSFADAVDGADEAETLARAAYPTAEVEPITSFDFIGPKVMSAISEEYMGPSTRKAILRFIGLNLGISYLELSAVLIRLRSEGAIKCDGCTWRIAESSDR